MGMGPPEALTSVCGDAKPPRVYSLLYVSAFPTNIVSMRVCDFYTRNRTKWMRITRGTSVEAPQPLVALLNDYLRAARTVARDGGWRGSGGVEQPRKWLTNVQRLS